MRGPPFKQWVGWLAPVLLAVLGCSVSPSSDSHPTGGAAGSIGGSAGGSGGSPGGSGGSLGGSGGSPGGSGGSLGGSGGSPAQSSQKAIPGSYPLLHPSGYIYTLGTGSYDVHQLDVDGNPLADWDGSLADLNLEPRAWAYTAPLPLADSGVLSKIEIGTDAIDVHVARYSKDGVLNWAVMLKHRGSGLTDGRYVMAIDSRNDTIALAGMQHIGSGGTGNSALITLLDADGNERKTFEYQFQSRQTAADAVRLDENGVCAAGDQWLGPNGRDAASGWMACWDNTQTLVWETSLDSPVVAIRPLDSNSFDVLTPTAWSTIDRGTGSAGNRRPLSLTRGDMEVALLGDHVLVLDRGAKSASIIDSTGATLWIRSGLAPTTLVGLSPSGKALLANFDLTLGSTVLYRFESSVMTDVPLATTTLNAPTLDISDMSANADCRAYCQKALAAQCGVLKGQVYSSTPECVTACLKPSNCSTEVRALAACVAAQGALACSFSDFEPKVSGCDQQSQALDACTL
jgi:hypothetical protein